MDDISVRSEQQPRWRPDTPDEHESQPDGPPSSPNKRKRWIIGGVIVLAILGSGAYWFYPRTSTPAASKSASSHNTPQPVGAGEAAKADVRNIVNALGTVTPLATVTVKTQINGQLISVPFKEGQLVKKGDLLAQIDDRPYQFLREQYQGQLMHDEGVLDQANMDLKRYQSLLKPEAIPRQTYEDQASIVKQDEGTVKTDHALVDTQTLNITYCHIVSPVDGRVGLRLVDPGNYVQTTDAGIAVVTQLHPISVVFAIPEDNIAEVMAEIAAGHTLQVLAFDPANVNQIGVGKVTNIDNQIDTTTGTLKIRAEFENQDGKLFPNQFVNAQLVVKTLRDVTVVPTASVQRGAPGTYVYKINDDDTVKVVPIKIGTTDGNNVQVISGLSSGDKVVVDGADRLRDGSKVIIPGQTPANTQGKPAQPSKNR